MSSTDFDASDKGDWAYLRSEICRRTWQPFSNVPFVFYAIIAIGILGCAGIWVEIAKTALSTKVGNNDGVLTALATFYPALIGSASLQLILSSTDKADKVVTSFALLVCIVSFASVALVSVFHAQMPELTVKVAVGFAVFAIWLWWIANADDPIYKNAPIDAPSGGSTEQKLSGSTEGFTQ